MAVNTAYYGAESSWIDFPLVTNQSVTDKFYVASGNTQEISTYGLSSRTWISGLIANDFEKKYKNPIDKSFGWCKTDGNAPFDSVYCLTGYIESGANAHDRIETNQSGASVIGLQMNGTRTPYTTAPYVKYFKSSSTGSVIADNAPHNFQPDNYTFEPRQVTQDNGFKYICESQSCLAPVLKFNFNRVFYLPFIHYYLLKDTATITDWNNVTKPSGYSELVLNSYTRDLRSFVKYFTDNPTHINRCVIFKISLQAIHFDFDDQGLIKKTNQTSGTARNSTGVIAPFALAEKTAKLTFKDWYKENGDTYSVDLDIGLIKNYTRPVGSVTIFDEHTNNTSSATLNALSSIVVAGLPSISGTGYYKPTTSNFYLEPSIFDNGIFTIKRFDSEEDFSTSEKHSISAYVGIEGFGGLNGLREYCRKAAAYTGGYFSESYYPLWHETLDDETCFLGIIDSSGITHGQYSHGPENKNQPQDKWGDEWGSKTPFKPDGPTPKPDKNPHEDPNPIRSTGLGFTTAYGHGSLCYALNSSDFEQIWGDIYGMGRGRWKDLLEGLALFGANPMNAILSYRWYPCSFSPSDSASVILGSTIVNSQHVYPIFKTVSETSYYNSGTYWLAQEGDYGDNNFYNLEKMTVTLWLPFYGFYELPTTKCISEELEIELYIDVPADTAQWIINFGGSFYDFVECTPYLEIPMTGDNSIQIAISKRNNAIQNALTLATAAAAIITGIGAAAPALSEIGAAATATGGNLLGAALQNIGPLLGDQVVSAAGLGAAATGLASVGSTIGKMMGFGQTLSQQANQIGSLKTNVPHHSGSDTTTFLHLPLKPIIYWWRPELFETFNKEEYMKTVGIATEQWNTINNMPDDSLLSISNPVYDTSGMTLQEIQALNSALTGFYK